jgi:4-amino-4-deoxy-L-arabinose transferase-like glycosyltransferase
VLWLNALWTAAAAACLYGLARKMGMSVRAGTFLLVLFLIYPRFYQHTAKLLTEPMYIALVVAGVLVLAGALERRGGGTAFAAGVVLGLATLVRPTTLFFPLALFPFMVIGRQRGGRMWVLLAIGFALTLSPWVARNAATFGEFEPSFTSRGYNLFMGTYPPTRGASNLPPEKQPPELVAQFEGKDEFAINRLYTKAAIENVREAPGEVLKLVGAKAVLCWFQTKPERNMFLPTPRSFVLNGPLLLLGVIGYALLFRRRKPLVWLPTLVIAYFVAVHLASVATVRYNLPSIPFVMLGAAYALDALVARVFPGRAPAGTTDVR